MKIKKSAIILLAITASAVLGQGLEVGTDSSHCEDIRVNLCRNLPYNKTVMPNLMGNQNQQDAENDIHQYHPLVKLECSPDIQLFICSMFTPVCTIITKALPPCRELCESAKAGCEPLMEQFSYSWPAQFDCDKFPRFGQSSGSLCVGQANKASFSDKELKRYETTTAVPKRPADYREMMDFVCPKAFQVPPEYEYKLSIGRQGHVVENCGAPCTKLFFGEVSIHQMRIWVCIWAFISIGSTLITISTFLIDTGRFPYPEKPIVYLSMCYSIVSIMFMIGTSRGNEIACNSFESGSHGVQSETIMKQGTLHDWRCSILGMLLYFFMTAGSIWWVVLTLAWFLSAGLKWGQESIDAIASYFHAVVWTLASLQTILVLILKKIEGNRLSSKGI